MTPRAVALQRGLAGGIAGAGGGGDLLRAERRRRQRLRWVAPGADKVVFARQAGAAEQRFDAAGLAAIAVEARILARHRPRQRVVAPFAGQPVGAAEHAAVHRDAGAHAGAQDRGEYHRRAGAGAVGGFGQGQTVGVVGHPHRLAQHRFEVGLQRAPVQTHRVRVLDPPRRGQAAGCAQADAARPGGDVARRRHQRVDGLQGGRVVAGRGRAALAPQLAALRRQQHRLDLAAAQVDAQRVHRRGLRSAGSAAAASRVPRR